MSWIICVTFEGALLATTKSRSAAGRSPSMLTLVTRMRVTFISPGRDASRSANKRDHENLLRSTRACAYFKSRFWSGVSAFFFQAEDGIRDKLVTGVQTCALPI